jgi:hypothetical protein
MQRHEKAAASDLMRSPQILNWDNVKRSWLCGKLPEGYLQHNHCLVAEKTKPCPGDVALVRIKAIGHHSYIETDRERRLRLYEGDHLMCVFGNRYATDVYEGLVLEAKKLHLLTGSGMIGTVVSQNRAAGRPTAVSMLGYLADANGLRVNLKRILYGSTPEAGPVPAMILVVGTGMNTGKTTVTRKLLQALASQGVPVAGCKFTGSASPRDLYEMRATNALHATDFSDYGFPSTYGADAAELLGLADRMLDACARKGSQVVVAEIADGILQRETQMLIENEALKSRVAGVVLAGSCSASALYGVEVLRKAGLDVWAVSGLITNSPLFVREFAARSGIPVGSSRSDGERLAKIIMRQMTAKRIFTSLRKERIRRNK